MSENVDKLDEELTDFDLNHENNKITIISKNTKITIDNILNDVKNRIPQTLPEPNPGKELLDDQLQSFFIGAKKYYCCEIYRDGQLVECVQYRKWSSAEANKECVYDAICKGGNKGRCTRNRCEDREACNEKE